MKRVSFDIHQSDNMDEDARLKYQNLLQDYLDIQKEYVSKKKKLQSVKQKRETLLAEVRFLRQKHKYLSKLQCPKDEEQDDLFARDENSNVVNNEAVGQKPSLDLGMRGKEEVISDPVTTEKKPQIYLTNHNRVAKKKISWQDPVVALKV